MKRRSATGTPRSMAKAAVAVAPPASPASNCSPLQETGLPILLNHDAPPPSVVEYPSNIDISFTCHTEGDDDDDKEKKRPSALWLLKNGNGTNNANNHHEETMSPKRIVISFVAVTALVVLTALVSAHFFSRKAAVRAQEHLLNSPLSVHLRASASVSTAGIFNVQERVMLESTGIANEDELQAMRQASIQDYLDRMRASKNHMPMLEPTGTTNEDDLEAMRQASIQDYLDRMRASKNYMPIDINSFTMMQGQGHLRNGRSDHQGTQIEVAEEDHEMASPEEEDEDDGTSLPEANEALLELAEIVGQGKNQQDTPKDRSKEEEDDDDESEEEEDDDDESEEEEEEEEEEEHEDGTSPTGELMAVDVDKKRAEGDQDDESKIEKAAGAPATSLTKENRVLLDLAESRGLKDAQPGKDEGVSWPEKPVLRPREESPLPRREDLQKKKKPKQQMNRLRKDSIKNVIIKKDAVSPLPREETPIPPRVEEAEEAPPAPREESPIPPPVTDDAGEESKEQPAEEKKEETATEVAADSAGVDKNLSLPANSQKRMPKKEKRDAIAKNILKQWGKAPDTADEKSLKMARQLAESIRQQQEEANLEKRKGRGKKGKKPSPNAELETEKQSETTDANPVEQLPIEDKKDAESNAAEKSAAERTTDEVPATDTAKETAPQPSVVEPLIVRNTAFEKAQGMAATLVKKVEQKKMKKGGRGKKAKPQPIQTAVAEVATTVAATDAVENTKINEPEAKEQQHKGKKRGRGKKAKPQTQVVGTVTSTASTTVSTQDSNTSGPAPTKEEQKQTTTNPESMLLTNVVRDALTTDTETRQATTEKVINAATPDSEVKKQETPDATEQQAEIKSTGKNKKKGRKNKRKN